MMFKDLKAREIAYHNTFASLEQRQVLVDILGVLGFFQTTITEDMTPAEQNILNLRAKKILMLAAGEEFGTIVGIILGLKPKKKTILERIWNWLKR